MSSGHVAALSWQGQDRFVHRCSVCRLEFLANPIVEVGRTASSVTSDTYRGMMLNAFEEVRFRVESLSAARLDHYERILGVKPKRILEVGCGAGWFVAEYKRLGVDCWGIEVDEMTSAAAIRGSTVRCADILVDDTSDLGQFDVVFASQTLEHLLDPGLGLSRMVERLRIGGVLHVDVPNASSWGSRARRLLRSDRRYGAISLPEHQVAYHPHSLEEALKLAGLNSISIQELPVDDCTFGQSILPTSLKSRAF